MMIAEQNSVWFIPLGPDTLFMVATTILVVLLLYNWYRRREEHEETSLDVDVAETVKTKWEQVKEVLLRMSPYMVAFAALLAFIFIPDGDNKLRFLAGVAFGLIFMEYVLERLMGLMAYNTFYAVNHEYEDMGVFDISNIMLPLYRIVDREGKPASLEYSMWDRHGRAWIVDAVDLHHRIIVVNPITSSMEFTKDYRLAYDEAVTDANEYFDKFNEAKTQLEQKVDKRAVEMLEQIGAWKSEISMPGETRGGEVEDGEE